MSPSSAKSILVFEFNFGLTGSEFLLVEIEELSLLKQKE